MAKRSKRKYSKGSQDEVRNEMRRNKKGTAKSGKVKSRKQAIAIALSKARKKGKKVPRKRSKVE
jgi:PBP1b-binding outer membrane lipoprotein LpoB